MNEHCLATCIAPNVLYRYKVRHVVFTFTIITQEVLYYSENYRSEIEIRDLTQKSDFSFFKTTILTPLLLSMTPFKIIYFSFSSLSLRVTRRITHTR